MRQGSRRLTQHAGRQGGAQGVDAVAAVRRVQLVATLWSRTQLPQQFPVLTLQLARQLGQRQDLSGVSELSRFLRQAAQAAARRNKSDTER